MMMMPVFLLLVLVLAGPSVGAQTPDAMCRALARASVSALATAACTRVVTVQLQAALAAATAGDVLCLSGTFRGSYTLPARPDSGWVVVRSAITLSTPGARMRPSLAGPLAKIVATAGGSASAITTAPRARGWYLRELEITTDSTLRVGPSPIVGIATPPDSLSWASDIVLDRLYVHGWPAQTVRRCILFNGAASSLVDSWVDDCHEKGADSQALASFSGMGPFLIRNNYLAGAGENIMFGGADPKFRTSPSDITIVGNHVHTPATWVTRWTKKNLLETKNARRVLIADNVFQGSWPDGQTGVAIVLKSANQSGACRWCITADVVIERNLILDASSPLNVNGRGGATHPVDSTSRRIEVTENYSDLTGAAPWTLDKRGIMLLSDAEDVRLTGNTWLRPAGVGADYTAGTGGPGPRYTLDRDAGTRPQYMSFGCWTAVCAPGLVRAGNVLIGAAVGTPPPGFVFVPTLDAALARGAGVSRATIDAAVRGVVILP